MNPSEDAVLPPLPRREEERRGEGLRRLDARFLLPLPPSGAFDHLVVLGGPAGLAETAAEAGIARCVSARLPRERSADALFVFHGAGVAPEQALACLAPGGSAWIETGSLRRRRPWGNGLRTTGLYAVLPGFERPGAYIPLDAPEPLRWYAETLLPSWTLGKRLRRAGLRLLGKALLPWRYGLTVTAAGGAATILDCSVLPSWTRGLRPLLLNHGLDRAVVLPFAPGGSSPEAVLKVPRLPALNAKTEEEQALLIHLRGRLRPEARGALPSPRGLYRAGGLALALEGYAPGRPLAQRAGSWGEPLRRKIEDLREAADWLARFHARTEFRRTEWDGREAEEWIGRPLEELGRWAGEGPPGITGAVRRRSQELAGAGLPIVCQHRDFTPWNLLWREGGLRVIDWEGARPGPALTDLLHFATHWSELALRAFDDGARLRAFRKVWIARQGGEAGEAVREAVAEYCRTLRIDRRFVPLLLVAAWVELALRQGPGGRETGYVTVLAQGADELLGAWNDAGWR